MMNRPVRFAIWVLASMWVFTPARADGPSSPLADELAAALSDFDRAQQVLAARPDDARPLFRASAQRMESLAARVPNGRLEYNIGNAFLQAGDVGRAILHYRRAARFIPRNELLADNLREARSRSILPIKASARDRVMTTLFFWQDQTSIRERATVALLAFSAMWVLLTGRLFIPRKPLVVIAAMCGFLFLITASSVTWEMWKDRRAPSGVILAMDVPVYKGPGTSYQRQFEQPLQPGVEFTLRERRGQWWRIELSDGKSGWLDAADADLVVTERSFPQMG